MNRYFHEFEGSIFSTAELLAEIFDGFHEEINLLAKDSDFTYIGDVDMQNNTYNLYCIIGDDTKLASKVFLTFHPQKTIMGKDKLVVSINMSHDQNQFPHRIYKKLHSMIKKKVNNIKNISEFKGKIKSIKI